MNKDEQINPFAIVPVEVVMDTRLTLETMRVLVTLFSFRNKVTGLTFPSRESISERCGMHPSNISEATKKLVELGWLSKDGKGGYSKVTRYTITIPFAVSQLAEIHKSKSDARKGIKVAEQATVAQSTTVAEQATSTVAQTATRQIADQATRQVAQTATRIEQTNRTDQLRTDQLTKSRTPRNPLLKDIDRQIASDFLAIRKAKNSPLTETALKGIEREAAKAGYTLEQALKTCCENNWAGFKAVWIIKADSQNGKINGRLPNKQELIEQSNRAVAANWLPPELREKNNEN